jgi:hypothetical protein
VGLGPGFWCSLWDFSVGHSRQAGQNVVEAGVGIDEFEQSSWSGLNFATVVGSSVRRWPVGQRRGGAKGGQSQQYSGEETPVEGALSGSDPR